MGGGAAGGPWRHQQWSSSWILPRIRKNIASYLFYLFIFFFLLDV